MDKFKLLRIVKKRKENELKREEGWFPSILLSILSTFSIMGKQKETLSFRFIEFSLSIPYRIFFQYSVI